MVINYIGVVIVAVRRGVEPPDLVPLLVSPADNLVRLIKVNVGKHVVTQGAGERLDAASVGVELIRPHPVGNVGGRSHGTGGGYRNVIRILLKREHIGSAKELEGIEVSVGPDEGFLPSRQCPNNPRAARYA